MKEVIQLKEIKIGFGKANVEINEDDLPIRDFSAILTNLTTRVVSFGNVDNVNFCLVSIDMTSITDRDIAIFKDRVADIFNLDNEQIWITATHTFSAPHLKHDLDTDNDRKTYDKYLNKILTSISEAAEEAKSNFQNTGITYHESYCPLNINRNIKTEEGYWLGRNFETYSNHQIRIIEFNQQDGTKNVIYNYDIQPSIMDHLNNDQNQKIITGDLFGVTSQKLEKTDVNVAVPLIGAAGDQSPIFKGSNDNSFVQNKMLLYQEAQVLYETIIQASSVNIPNDFELNYFKFMVKLPSQKRQLDTFDIKPTKSYKFKSDDVTINAHVFGLQLGSIIILGTEPELNSKFAEKCRQQINTPAVLITTLTNGAQKYLPEQDDFEHITYAAMNTSIGKGADKILLKSFKKVNQYLGGK